MTYWNCQQRNNGQTTSQTQNNGHTTHYNQYPQVIHQPHVPQVLQQAHFPQVIHQPHVPQVIHNPQVIQQAHVINDQLPSNIPRHNTHLSRNKMVLKQLIEQQKLLSRQIAFFTDLTDPTIAAQPEGQSFQAMNHRRTHNINNHLAAAPQISNPYLENNNFNAQVSNCDSNNYNRQVIQPTHMNANRVSNDNDNNNYNRQVIQPTHMNANRVSNDNDNNNYNRQV
eukprot:134887_1